MLFSIAVAACGGGGGGGTSATGGGGGGNVPPTTGTQQGTFSISGTAPSGATLTLSGQATASVQTTAGGTYSFVNLAPGSYTVTPSLSGNTFSPISTAVTISNGDVAGINFAAIPNAIPTYSISGTANAGTTLNMTGQASASTVAGANGIYTFTNVASGNYLITPVLTGYSFTPASHAVTVNGANVSGVIFAATTNPAPTYSVSGTTRAGTTLNLSGQTTVNTTSDLSGNYSFIGLANGSYTVTPALMGYSFAPTSHAVIVNGANVSGITFTATANPAPTYSISGNVSGAVSSGVTISLSPGSASTVTDASGNYVFSSVAQGNYTVTPSLAGHTFTPASASVSVSAANVPGVNFTEPIPVLATGKIFYSGEDAVLAANGGDGAIYSHDLAVGTTTRLWGGYQCPPGGCAVMFPDIIVPVRAVGSVVFKGSNIPCLAIMPLATMVETCVTPTGATSIAVMGSFDATQNGDIVVLAEGNSTGPAYKQNIVVYRTDGSWFYSFITNGPDIDSSPVFSSAGGLTSTAVTVLFVRNHTEIRQQIVDMTTGTPVGTSTVFATNVTEGAVRAMSVNATYTHVAFTRSVGGVSHIIVKPLVGGAEVDLGTGADPYWATNGSDLIKYTANNALWAMKPDGTGKVQIPTPSNLAINGSSGTACGNFCLGNVTIAPAWY